MPIQSHIITLAGENMYPSLLIVVCIIATKHTSSGADLGIFCKKKKKRKKGDFKHFQYFVINFRFEMPIHLSMACKCRCRSKGFCSENKLTYGEHFSARPFCLADNGIWLFCDRLPRNTDRIEWESKGNN